MMNFVFNLQILSQYLSKNKTKKQITYFFQACKHSSLVTRFSPSLSELTGSCWIVFFLCKKQIWKVTLRLVPELRWHGGASLGAGYGKRRRGNEKENTTAS